MTLHTLNNSLLVSLLLKSVSSVTEVRMFRRQSHLRGMGGKSRKLGSAKGVGEHTDMRRRTQSSIAVQSR